MGWALDAPKVFLRRRVKPLRLGKTGAFVLDAIDGANAVLELIQAGDLSGLLVVSVKGLISCNPSIITMVPDKNYNATGPSRAMVLWREREVVLLQVHVLVQRGRPGLSSCWPIVHWRGYQSCRPPLPFQLKMPKTSA
jgi:hypothetical protein